MQNPHCFRCRDSGLYATLPDGVNAFDSNISVFEMQKLLVVKECDCKVGDELRLRHSCIAADKTL